MSSRLVFFLLSIVFLLKIFAINYTNFDLFGDEAQYWLWSQRLDLGYYSKPPLLAWLISVTTFIFGNSFVVLKLIPFTMYFFSSYVVFLISYELYQNKKIAIISGISFYLMPATSVSSFILSTDIVLIFFWSLCLLMLLKIRSGPHLINFLLLGVFLGLSFLAKYATIYFILSLLLFLFFDIKLRKIFIEKTQYIFIFIITVIIVVLPNIIWNIKNSWITFSHTSDNAALDRININLFQGLEFLLIQAVMLGPLLFIFFVFTSSKIKLNFQTRFLLCFSLPVFLIILIESVLVRANANWAAVALPALLILLINHANGLTKKIIYFNGFINGIFCCVLFFLILTSSSLKVFDRISGVSLFAENLEKNHLSNIDFLVVENRLLFSSLSYFFKDSKKTLLTPYRPLSDIKSSFHLSSPLDASFKKTFVFIGNPNNIDYLINEKNILKKETVKFKFKNGLINIYEVVF